MGRVRLNSYAQSIVKDETRGRRVQNLEKYISYQLQPFHHSTVLPIGRAQEGTHVRVCLNQTILYGCFLLTALAILNNKLAIDELLPMLCI